MESNNTKFTVRKYVLFNINLNFQKHLSNIIALRKIQPYYLLLIEVS
jgi:hypothetical protein